MSAPDANKPVTIFIVDDEPLILDLARSALVATDFIVCTYRDPKKALLDYPAAMPEVIVTDYAMTTMNGMDLVRECRCINPRQKFILISGTVDETIFADEPVKPDLFLAKPYQIREFVDTIQKLAKR